MFEIECCSTLDLDHSTQFTDANCATAPVNCKISTNKAYLMFSNTQLLPFPFFPILVDFCSVSREKFRFMGFQIHSVLNAELTNGNLNPVDCRSCQVARRVEFISPGIAEGRFAK